MSFFKKLFGTPQEAPTDNEVAPQDETINEEEHEKRYNFETLRDDGLRAMNIRQPALAIKYFMAALEFMPEDEETQGHLAEAYIQTGQGKMALEILNKLSTKHPNEFKLFYALGQAEELAQEWEPMLAAAQKAHELNPEEDNALFMLARAQYKTKDFLAAIASLTKLLAVDESFMPVRQLRGQILFEMKQYADAENDTNFLIGHQTATEDTYQLKGEILEAQDNMDGALQNYKKIEELNPFSHEYILKTANVYIKTNKLDKALQMMDDAIENEPDFAEAFKLRGNIKLLLHDEQGSMDDLKKALELAPEEQKDMDGKFSNIEQETEEKLKELNPFGF